MPTTPESDGPRRIAQRLRLNTDRLRRVVRRAGVVPGLPRPQEAVLSLLERQGPLTTAQLARREQLRPQSMGAIVAELAAKGFVDKSQDPGDARQAHITLTEDGLAEMARVNQLRDSDLAHLIERRLTGEDLATLSAALDLLEGLDGGASA